MDNQRKLLIISCMAIILLACGCMEKGEDGSATEDGSAAKSLSERRGLTVESVTDLLDGVKDSDYSVDLTDIKVEVTDVGGGKQVEIVCPPSDSVLDEKGIVEQAAGNSVYAMSELFKDSTVENVTVAQQWRFTDSYGQSKVDDAVAVSMDRATADKIDWVNFKDMVKEDYNNLAKASNQFTINAAILRELRMEQREERREDDVGLPGRGRRANLQ